MSRSTLDSQVEVGMLTASSAAEVMPMSRTTIANLGRKNVFKRISTPGVRETRYSAMELFAYCVNNCLPVNSKLSEAAGNYARKYSLLDEYLALLLHCKPKVATNPASTTPPLAGGSIG